MDDDHRRTASEPNAVGRRQISRHTRHRHQPHTAQTVLVDGFAGAQVQVQDGGVESERPRRSQQQREADDVRFPHVQEERFSFAGLDQRMRRVAQIADRRVHRIRAGQTKAQDVRGHTHCFIEERRQLAQYVVSPGQRYVQVAVQFGLVCRARQRYLQIFRKQV